MCMEQVSCSDNSRRSFDYRCGEGGLEIKIEEMTDVLQQTGMCNKKMSLCPIKRLQNMPEGFLCKNKSKVVETRVIAERCLLLQLRDGQNRQLPN